MDHVAATDNTIGPQDHVDAIHGAARLIRSTALELHAAHTVADDPLNWCGDDDAQQDYDAEIGLAESLDKAAESYINLMTERDALLAALVGLVEERQPLGIERETYQTALQLIVTLELREAEE